MAPRPGLDRAAVVQAAAALVNAQGIEALSLHELARTLKVQPSSLYNHIDGLPGLRRDLALLSHRLLAERMSAAAVGKAGPQALLAAAQAYRAHVQENPGVYAASLRASAGQDAELQAAEERVVTIVLAVIASYDLHGADALHAVRGLRSLVHGFATLEAAGGFGLPLDCDESFRRLVMIFSNGLRPER